MLKTLEMRWFKQGDIPTSVREWFEKDCMGNGESRTDWYLIPIAPCDYLNIKFRQGRLEIKWREKQYPTVNLNSQWQGIMEAWVKWLCEAESMEGFLPQHQGWVAVEKARSQRQIVLSPEACCNLELTQLRVKNQPWWTVGLESTGDEESLSAIAQQLSQTCPETLTEKDASAYPHWLAQKVMLL